MKLSPSLGSKFFLPLSAPSQQCKTGSVLQRAMFRTVCPPYHVTGSEHQNRRRTITVCFLKDMTKLVVDT